MTGYIIPKRRWPYEVNTHHIKSWPRSFEAILNGTKTHDLRLNDREYRVGDIIEFSEYLDLSDRYTGRRCTAKITYITSIENVCPKFMDAMANKDYAILSIQLLRGEDERS